MINKGNPYHDDSGKFTSKEGQGAGSVKEKAEELGSDKRNPFSDSKLPGSKELGDFWSDLFGFNKKVENTKKKYYPATLDGEILDEEGIEAESEEEAMKIAEERFGKYGDELMVFADDEDESQPDYEDSKEEAMKMFGMDEDAVVIQNKEHPEFMHVISKERLDSVSTDEWNVIDDKNEAMKLFDLYKDSDGE